MAKATYLGGLYEIDKNYDAIFWTEWNTRLAAVMELVNEKDLVGTDRYQLAELVAGFATAPKSSEGADFTYLAPQDGKNYSVTTDIYKFAFKATQELRDFGRSGQIYDYARIMAEIMDHTVKVNIYNMFNRATNASYPVAYDNTVLLSTSHTLANGATAANKLATDADPGEACLGSLIELHMNTPNEDGQFIGQVPRVYVTSATNWVTGTQATSSSTTTLQGLGESGNAVNAITRAWNIVPHFSPYITDSDASYLLSDNSPLSLVWARRPDLMPVYEDPKNNDWIWRIKAQFKVVADTWRGITGTTGAA